MSHENEILINSPSFLVLGPGGPASSSASSIIQHQQAQLNTSSASSSSAVYNNVPSQQQPQSSQQSRINIHPHRGHHVHHHQHGGMLPVVAETAIDAMGSDEAEPLIPVPPNRTTSNNIVNNTRQVFPMNGT